MKRNLLTARLLTIAAVMLTLVACGQKEKKSYEKYAMSGLTERTDNLRANLTRFAEKGIMIGQEYGTLQGVGWSGDSCRSDIQSVCNDFPACNGYNLDGMERGGKRNADGFSAAQLHSDILETARRGGLILCRWAMPKAKDAAEQAQWIETMARFIDSLQDGYGIHAPVVLILMPLEKGAWYAGLDAADYKDLYKSAVSALKDTGVKNAVYGYSVALESVNDAFMAKYPDGAASVAEINAVTASADRQTYAAALVAAMENLKRVGQSYGAALGVTMGMTNADTDDYWQQTVIPVLHTMPLSYALFGSNSGQPSAHKIHVPFPGGSGINGFMALYNDDRTLFAHDVNGLYLEPKQ